MNNYFSQLPSLLFQQQINQKCLIGFPVRRLCFRKKLVSYCKVVLKRFVMMKLSGTCYYSPDMSSIYNGIMGKVILLLIGVSSFKCTSSGCVSGAAHQQLQYQRFLGASGPQPSEWRNSGVQGETGAVTCDDTWLPPWLSASIFDRYFCC